METNKFERELISKVIEKNTFWNIGGGAFVRITAKRLPTLGKALKTATKKGLIRFRRSERSCLYIVDVTKKLKKHITKERIEKIGSLLWSNEESKKIADPMPWPPIHRSYLRVGMMLIFRWVKSTINILPV